MPAVLCSIDSPFGRLVTPLRRTLSKVRGEDRVSVDRLRQHLLYDPQSGILTWLDRPFIRACVNARTRFQVAGKTSDGYVRITITVDGVECYLLGHRIAWALMLGEWPSEEIDHRDRDGLNNRWVNLRPASSQENKFNTGGWTRKELPKGVFVHPQREGFFSSCRHNGKNNYLGTFSTPDAAKVAYDRFASSFQGEFANA